MTDNIRMTKINREIKMIVVDADGVIVTAANGLVSSDDRELVRAIKRESLLMTPVQFVAPYGEWVQANLDDPNDSVSIAAALFSVRPGRTRLLEAPAEVWEWLDNDDNKSQREPESFPDVTTREELRQLRESAESFAVSDDKLVELLIAPNTNEEK